MYYAHPEILSHPGIKLLTIIPVSHTEHAEHT